MASLNSVSTLPSALTANKTMQPPPPQQQVNYVDDTSSIAMFTAVGHVGLHFVVRPLLRWGIRSLILKAKAYNGDSASDAAKRSEASLKSESQIKEELLQSSSSLRLKSKKEKTLSNIGNGIAGPYSELVCTFGSLAGISYVSHPQNVLVYFGVTYPSMPFLLRFVHTLNDKKSKITVARTARLGAKGIIVTGGFGVSMALAGVLLQNIPFFNIFCLALWDCFADFVLSDGPNQ